MIGKEIQPEISTTKRMAKNLSWLATGNLTSGLLNFLTIIYIARTLGAVYFGIWQFAMAFLAYLVLFVDSGLSIFGMREIAQARHKAGRISLNLFAIRLTIAVVIYSIAVMLLLTFPIQHNLRIIFLAVFLMIFYRALNADWVFQGLEKMEFISLAKICYSVSSLVLILLIVKTPLDVFKVPFIQAFCGIIFSTFFMFLLYKYLVKLDFSDLIVKEWPRYLITTIPLGASIIMIQIYNNLDTIMLGFMAKPEIVGFYNAAYQIFYVFVGLFYIWLSIAMPVMSRRINEDRAGAERFISKYARLTMLVFIPIVVYTFIVTQPIINILFGSVYAPAIPALQILIWNLITVIIGSIFGALILIPVGHFNEYFIAVLFGAVLNLCLNFILIPSYSYLGAAVATILAEASAVTIVIFYARRIIFLKIVNYVIRPALISFFCAILFKLTVILTYPFSFYIKYIAGSVVFMVFYLIIILIYEKMFIVEFIKEIIGRSWD